MKKIKCTKKRQIIPYYKNLGLLVNIGGNKVSITILLNTCNTHSELSDFNPTNASGAK